ncbi:MAG: ATP-binding protein, partial [Pseudomonadales bacterium]|nr:ATP-binding protein [Pseudomonadales bacterium]
PDQFAANCVPVDLEVLAQDVSARFYPVVEQHRQSLELDSESVLVRGDPFALETLLSNLLTNASKYTQEGGAIMVTVKQQRGEAVLRVSDNGPGISDAEKPRVFERFYRRDDPDTQRQPGCGLGLTIVLHVAHLHQARVEVDDAPGGGTQFTVSFPLLPREAHA